MLPDLQYLSGNQPQSRQGFLPSKCAPQNEKYGVKMKSLRLSFLCGTRSLILSLHVLLSHLPTNGPMPPKLQVLIVTTSSFCFPSINNKLQQPEAAAGVLEYAMKHFGELVSTSFPLEKQEAAA